jgi:hypothetical protein
MSETVAERTSSIDLGESGGVAAEAHLEVDDAVAVQQQLDPPSWLTEALTRKVRLSFAYDERIMTWIRQQSSHIMGPDVLAVFPNLGIKRISNLLIRVFPRKRSSPQDIINHIKKQNGRCSVEEIAQQFNVAFSTAAKCMRHSVSDQKGE